MFLLPVFALIFTCILWMAPGRKWAEAISKGYVTWGAFLVLLTEMASFVGKIEPAFLASIWGVVVLVLAVLAADRLLRIWKNGSLKSHFGTAELNWEERLALIFTLLISVTTLICAVAFPPTTWDSMTYHLSRVFFWAQNHSVAPFPTTIPRQIFMNPWTEFAVLNFYVLSGAQDFLAGFVQWQSFIVSLILASGISGLMGAGRKGRVFSAFFVASAPSLILQSSSTQTDITFTSWALATIYFILADLKDLSPMTAWVCLSLALSFSTKGLAVPILSPFLIYWAYHKWKNGSWKWIARTTVTGSLGFILINGIYLLRNFRVYKNPLGDPQMVERGKMLDWGIRPWISNILRNLVLHWQTPSNPLNEVWDRALRIFHQLVGYSIDDPRTSWAPFTLQKLSPQEDVAGDLILIFLITMACVKLLRRRQFHQPIFFGLIAASFLLFCFTFKWQPWHVRLHSPVVAMAAIWIGSWLATEGGPKLKWLIVGVFFAALPFLFLNKLKPLIPGFYNAPEMAAIKTTSDKYFYGRATLRIPYKEAAQHLASMDCRSMGLHSSADAWEYPLLQLAPRSINWRHIMVNEASQTDLTQIGGSELCGVVAIETFAYEESLPPPFEKFRLKLRTGPLSIFAQP